MISFPNAKINLGLNVVKKRNDGYHDIETVFYPIRIKDALEIIKSDKFNFEYTGLDVDGPSEQNLCVKAYHLLRKDFPQIPHIQLHLHKNIPMGAGLGGGSSDAAEMLLLLNRKFDLNLTTEKLANYALLLGSDCPFFIYNKPSFATGRGDKLEQIILDLSAYTLCVIYPHIHVSTKAAFSQLTPLKPVKSIKDIVSQPIDTWKQELKNDFEMSVFKSYPGLGEIKEELYECGALYASMTGSGSSVFGLFEKEKNLHRVFSRKGRVFVI